MIQRWYEIVRFYADRPLHPEVRKTGLSLEEAQAHCQDPTTREEGVWFDGYRECRGLNQRSEVEKFLKGSLKFVDALSAARQ